MRAYRLAHRVLLEAAQHAEQYLDVERGNNGVVKLYPLPAAVSRPNEAVIVPRIGCPHVHHHTREVVMVVFFCLLFLAITRLPLPKQYHHVRDSFLWRAKISAFVCVTIGKL